MKRYASIITVPAALLILYFLFKAIFQFSLFKDEEGWGILVAMVAIPALIITLIIGIVIRELVKSSVTKILIEIILFALLSYMISQSL